MSKIKVKKSDWLEYLESQVNKTLYVWGANDELCVNLLDKLVEMEKSDHKTDEALKNIDRILTLLQKRLLVGCDMLKIRCADCSGLAVGFLLKMGIIKSDTTADGFYNMLKKRSVPFSDVQAGDFLFMGSESHKTHVGYAISNQYAIESKSRDVGVVQTKISERGWGWACRPDWYESKDKPVLDRELYLTEPMMRGDDVKNCQKLLIEKGYNPGTVDGIFGKNTEISVKNFQTDSKLDVKRLGVVGRKTAEALGFIWEG